MIQLGEVADFEMGQAPPGTECNMDGEGTVFVKAGEFSRLYPLEREWTTKPLKFGKHGDVFICVVGATAGKLNLGIDCAIGRSVAAIRPKPVLETKFLYYQLLPSVLKLRASSAGSAQGVISKKQLSEIQIILPSISEQTEIVAEIEKQFSRLDEAVTNLQRAKANLKRYKASVLQAAIEGRLVSGSEKPVSIPLKTLIGKIAQGWSPKCELNRDALPDEWAIITTTAVQPMQYLDNQGKPLPSKFEPRPHLEIKAGDFLVTRKGPRKRAGVACLVRSTRHRLMVCDTVYRFRCDESKVLPGYLELVLNAPTIVDAIDKHKAGISESGVSLTHDKLGSVLVPVPSKTAQAIIVAEVDRCLSIVRGVEAEVDVNLKRAHALRQATLSKAFS